MVSMGIDMLIEWSHRIPMMYVAITIDEPWFLVRANYKLVGIVLQLLSH